MVTTRGPKDSIIWSDVMRPIREALSSSGSKERPTDRSTDRQTDRPTGLTHRRKKHERRSTTSSSWRPQGHVGHTEGQAALSHSPLRPFGD